MMCRKNGSRSGSIIIGGGLGRVLMWRALSGCGEVQGLMSEKGDIMEA
jgi:hypothetical protein